jgi:hypothetical protein
MCHLSLSWRTICLNGIAWYDFYHSLSSLYLLQKDIFIKYTPLLTMLLIYMYVLQQKIPQACTPRWMLGLKGEVTIVCARPWTEPFKHNYYTESGSDGCVKIKAWLKIRVQKKPRPGDRLFSILYLGEYGRPFWVYFFLPSRVD